MRFVLPGCVLSGPTVQVGQLGTRHPGRSPLSHGIDLFIGRRLPRLLRAAGLMEIDVRPLISVYPPRDTRRPLFLQFANNLHDRIVAHGLITEAKSAEASAAVARHLDDPTTLVVSTVVFQAWGRKPGQ
jgi:hypothetical protein